MILVQTDRYQLSNESLDVTLQKRILELVAPVGSEEGTKLLVSTLGARGGGKEFFGNLGPIVMCSDSTTYADS